ncbi:MAG TPA: alanine--glyoxylate aminotransferase family protein, partial [Pyrodictium sp.]|nr:alanine--glyoxylate aminotransferase family protein [Pyrodictium sp.]
MCGELLFTPGPVMMHKRALEAMARQVVSHRSEEFRRLLDDVRELLVKVYQGGEPLVLTGSGTLAVESMAWSIVEPGEQVLVVSHGEFG